MGTKGIDLAENVSIWVECLMRKLMQALGMKVAETKEELMRSPPLSCHTMGFALSLKCEM